MSSTSLLINICGLDFFVGIPSKRAEAKFTRTQGDVRAFMKTWERITSLHDTIVAHSWIFERNKQRFRCKIFIKGSGVHARGFLHEWCEV